MCKTAKSRRSERREGAAGSPPSKAALILFLERKRIKKNFNLAAEALRFRHFRTVTADRSDRRIVSHRCRNAGIAHTASGRSAGNDGFLVSLLGHAAQGVPGGGLLGLLFAVALAPADGLPVKADLKEEGLVVVRAALGQHVVGQHLAASALDHLL